MKPTKLGTAGKWRENTIGNFRPIVSQATADFGIAYPHPKYQCDDEYDQGVLHRSLAILFSQEFFHRVHTGGFNLRSCFLVTVRSKAIKMPTSRLRIAGESKGSHEPKFPFAMNDNVDGRSCPPSVVIESGLFAKPARRAADMDMRSSSGTWNHAAKS